MIEIVKINWDWIFIFIFVLKKKFFIYGKIVKNICNGLLMKI